MSSTLHDSFIILQLIGLENVTSHIIIKRVIIDALLLAFSIILDRAHSVGCHRAFFDRSESFQVVLNILVVILIIPVIESSITLFVLSILWCVILPTLRAKILSVFSLILSDELSALTYKFALLDSSLLHSKDFFKTNAFHVCFH